MRVLLLIVVVAAAICVLQTDAKKHHRGKKVKAQKNIVCYFESWARYRPGNGAFNVEDIDVNLCTHAIYAFIGLNPDGTVKIFDPWGDVDLEGYRRFTNLKQLKPSLKTLIAIGGWSQSSEDFSTVAANPVLRTKMVNEVYAFIKQYNFDGLDLDWEYPGQRGGRPEDKANFVLMVKELRAKLSPEGLMLTAAVGANVAMMEVSYDVPQLAANMDFFNLMAYDFHGAWDPVTGINAPLYAAENDEDQTFNADAAVKHWIQEGAPASMINLGMATYGRTFTIQSGSNMEVGAPHDGPGQQGKYTGEPGFLNYLEICELHMEGGWTKNFHDEQKVPYAYKGTQWVGYENIMSIGLKAEYVNQYGLGGAMVWALDNDDFHGTSGDGKFPLISKIKSIIG